MDYDVIVIGTGFGGCMTALTLAERTRGQGKKILMLERGTWWTTPLSTVQDKEVSMYAFLRRKHQPVQFWSSQDHFRGFIDLVTRCFVRTRDSSLLTRWFPRLRNEDGLLETNWFGRRTPVGRSSDGLLIARASGVGGGSLVYSNITIRPPDFVTGGPRWPSGIWSDDPAKAAALRDYYYDYARDAIGVGIVQALRNREADGRSPVANSHPWRFAAAIVNFTPGTSIEVDLVVPGSPNPQRQTFTVADAMTNDIKDDLRVGRQVWLDLDADLPAGKVVKIIPQGGFRINTGLSNILARTARLDAAATVLRPGNQFNKRDVIGLPRPPAKDPADLPAAPEPKVPQDPKHALWLNRAHVFQSAIREMTSDYGAVDLSINDLVPDVRPLVTNASPKNYCERQGRCNIGCLPGARHTLNKQLARAVVGRFRPDAPDKEELDFPPDYPDLELRTLSRVEVIRALDAGGYAVDFEQQEVGNYRDQEAGRAKRKVERKTLTAHVVIVSAGTLGTNELLLRSKASGGLPGLSEKTGYGFSANGDYIAFMAPTTKSVGLTKGPVTTSFGHFETDEPGTGAEGATGDPARFHTVEDQGIPPATASLIGEGMSLIQSVAKGNTGHALVLCALLRYAWKWLRRAVHDLFTNSIRRGRLFESEAELAARMMAVAVMGRDEANATFRLGKGAGETTLRVSKPNGVSFSSDPIYRSIRATLERLAKRLGDPATAAFIHPLLNETGKGLKVDAIATSHPLGGCIMAADPGSGTVNPSGQPFNVSADSASGLYDGLYVADGSIVPSALGVNPSLTISALSLRIADRIFENHFAAAA